MNFRMRASMADVEHVLSTQNHLAPFLDPCSHKSWKTHQQQLRFSFQMPHSAFEPADNPERAPSCLHATSLDANKLWQSSFCCFWILPWKLWKQSLRLFDCFWRLTAWHRHFVGQTRSLLLCLWWKKEARASMAVSELHLLVSAYRHPEDNEHLAQLWSFAVGKKNTSLPARQKTKACKITVKHAHMAAWHLSLDLQFLLSEPSNSMLLTLL